MKKILVFISIASIFLACKKDKEEECKTQNLIAARNAGKTIPGRYVLKFRDHLFDNLLNAAMSFDQRQQLMQQASRTWLLSALGAEAGVGAVFTEVMQGMEVVTNEERANILRNHPDVDLLEEVKVYSVFADCTTPPSQVDLQVVSYGTIRVGSASGQGRRAWIIDTGIDLDHPDLTVNTSLSRNFINPQQNADDDDGHGTHVAGIIGAKNNLIGTRGVAFGAELVAVKVLDSIGEGNSATVIQGIDYIMALAQPGEVINLSLGGGPNTLVDLSIQVAANKGVFFAIAAGNESEPAASHSPARAEGANIYTISAMDELDRFASFSNFGNPPIDYAQPGVSILSSYKNGVYRRISGTSMAAPHMAGILLLRGRNFGTGGTVSNDPDGNPDKIATLN